VNGPSPAKVSFRSVASIASEKVLNSSQPFISSRTSARLAVASLAVASSIFSSTPSSSTAPPVSPAAPPMTAPTGRRPQPPPLLLPACRQRPFQLLQNQALVRPSPEDRLSNVRGKQRQPEDPASVIGPRVSIPHRLRRVAELVLLSVVDARPPHDAVRWSG
jgi:hypothetical protein